MIQGLERLILLPLTEAWHKVDYTIKSVKEYGFNRMKWSSWGSGKYKRKRLRSDFSRVENMWSEKWCVQGENAISMLLRWKWKLMKVKSVKSPAICNIYCLPICDEGKCQSNKTYGTSKNNAKCHQTTLGAPWSSHCSNGQIRSCRWKAMHVTREECFHCKW